MEKNDLFELMIICNDPLDARMWEAAGVDIIFIDLERMGKEERQAGQNAVFSNHNFSDISRVRGCLSESQILVRLNPFYDGTKAEVDEAISRGADILMLPMFEHVWQVERFRDIVNGRAKVRPLIETRAALRDVDLLAGIEGIDGFHFGLNDLHLQYGMRFMFEVLLLDEFLRATKAFHRNQLKFGIGGVSALGEGRIPAELILNEHRRLGSRAAILSRAFKASVSSGKKTPHEGVSEIKDYYNSVQNESLTISRTRLAEKIREIAACNE